MKNQFILKLDSTYMLYDSCRHMRFMHEDSSNFEFVPGQFIQIHFEHQGKLLRRSYSIATVVNEKNNPYIEIAVSYVQGGAATELLSNMQPNETLLASGPYGRFCLTGNEFKRYIFVATGTGVTPFRSMLPEIKQRIDDNDEQFVLLFGVREEKELLYGNEFIGFANNEKNFTFVPCFSRQPPAQLNFPFQTGHVQAYFDRLNLNPEQDMFFLCGNPNMIDDTTDLLKNIGFSIQQIRREKYISPK